jgi:hypothetical protein
VSRTDPKHFADLFSLDALDRLLAQGDVWHPNVRVFLAGEQLAYETYAARPWAYGRDVHRRVIDVAKLADYFRRGATINLLGLERTSPEVMNLSKDLEIEAGFPVHTTAFLSPPNAVNVPPHFDMVDVIVTQIHGSKNWNVWLPTRDRPLVTDTSGRLYDRDDRVVSDDALVGHYELQAGDTLYVPRGFLHEAITTTESSLHLAFGINVHRWYDVVERAAKDAVSGLAQVVEFRQALPIKGRGETGAAGRDEMLGRLRDDLGHRIASGLDEAFDATDRTYLSSRTPARPGQLQTADRLDGLALDDRLVRRRHLAFGITTRSGRLELVFHQKRLWLGRELDSALRRAAEGTPFAVADLPGLSSARQLAFARRLLAEGFLSFDDAEHGDPTTSLRGGG